MNYSRDYDPRKQRRLTQRVGCDIRCVFCSRLRFTRPLITPSTRGDGGHVWFHRAGQASLFAVPLFEPPATQPGEAYRATMSNLNGVPRNLCCLLEMIRRMAVATHRTVP